jgi:hypothetical protein
MDLLQADLPWDEKKAQLLRFPYATSTREAERPTDPGELAQWDPPMNEPNTWDEVERSRWLGYITHVEFRDLVRAWHATHDSAQPTPR